MDFNDFPFNDSGKLPKWVSRTGILALVALLMWWAWGEHNKRLVVLLPGGKAEFRMGGILYPDVLPLERYRNKWRLPEGEFVVPFECQYNATRRLLIDAAGHVYIVDKESFTRTELRVVNGEWSYDASDHWQSIFDLE